MISDSTITMCNGAVLQVFDPRWWQVWRWWGWWRYRGKKGKVSINGGRQVRVRVIAGRWDEL